jgi:hypothetical protein
VFLKIFLKVPCIPIPDKYFKEFKKKLKGIPLIIFSVFAILEERILK